MIFWAVKVKVQNGWMRKTPWYPEPLDFQRMARDYKWAALLRFLVEEKTRNEITD